MVRVGVKKSCFGGERGLCRPRAQSDIRLLAQTQVQTRIRTRNHPVHLLAGRANPIRLAPGRPHTIVELLFMKHVFFFVRLEMSCSIDRPTGTDVESSSRMNVPCIYTYRTLRLNKCLSIVEGEVFDCRVIIFVNLIVICTSSRKNIFRLLPLTSNCCSNST